MTDQKWNNQTAKWLAEEVENRGAEWVLTAIFDRRDQEDALLALARTIKRHEKELTALGIQFPGGGQLLYPVATRAIEKLVSLNYGNDLEPTHKEETEYWRQRFQDLVKQNEPV